MKNWKKLYDHVEQCNTEESWRVYRKTHNKVNKMVQSAHERYCTRILDTKFPEQQRQFCKYIKAMKKSTSFIPSLTVDEHTIRIKL